jgi:hypothetical protein
VFGTFPFSTPFSALQITTADLWALALSLCKQPFSSVGPQILFVQYLLLQPALHYLIELAD